METKTFSKHIPRTWRNGTQSNYSNQAPPTFSSNIPSTDATGTVQCTSPSMLIDLMMGALNPTTITYIANMVSKQVRQQYKNVEVTHFGQETMPTMH